jgi:GDP-D-mannose dehydratase
LTPILREFEPDELDNLGAESHEAVSFEMPKYTEHVNATEQGTARQTGSTLLSM